MPLAPSIRHPPRRALWSEFVPYTELRSPALLRALSRRGIALRVAVAPDAIGEVPGLRVACASAGVELGVWPLLDDAGGRWASCSNASAFAEHAREVGRAARGGAGPAAPVAVDLEPPIGRVRQALSGRFFDLVGRRHPWDRATAELVDLVIDLRRRSHRVEAAAIPAVLVDAGAGGWQRVLGTPVDALPVDHVSVMLYTTLIEGYSRRALRRRDARALLAGLTGVARRRYGRRAGVSLGVVAGGALGDERGYREPGELADDVALARAAGVDALSLYCLDGVLARPPMETWLDVFVSAAPPPARGSARTWRAAAAMAGLAAASPALGALSRR